MEDGTFAEQQMLKYGWSEGGYGFITKICFSLDITSASVGGLLFYCF